MTGAQQRAHGAAGWVQDAAALQHSVPHHSTAQCTLWSRSVVTLSSMKALMLCRASRSRSSRPGTCAGTHSHLAAQHNGATPRALSGASNAIVPQLLQPSIEA